MFSRAEATTPSEQKDSVASQTTGYMFFFLYLLSILSIIFFEIIVLSCVALAMIFSLCVTITNSKVDFSFTL